MVVFSILPVCIKISLPSVLADFVVWTGFVTMINTCRKCLPTGTGGFGQPGSAGFCPAGQQSRGYPGVPSALPSSAHLTPQQCAHQGEAPYLPMTHQNHSSTRCSQLVLSASGPLLKALSRLCAPNELFPCTHCAAAYTNCCA